MMKKYQPNIRIQKNSYPQYSTRKDRAVWVMHDTVERLKKIKAKFKVASMEDAIILLMDEYEKTHGAVGEEEK